MNDELRDEYELDYKKAKPNRFAAGMQQGGRLVILAPDVAEAFPEAEAVNQALRSLMKKTSPTDKASTSAA